MRSSQRDPETDPSPTANGRVPSHDLLDLWFALARREWSSLVITPAHANGSADELAKALAEAGQSLSDHPVSALTSQVLNPASVRALAALVEHVGGRSPAPAWRGPAPTHLKRLNPPAAWPAPVSDDEEAVDAEFEEPDDTEAEEPPLEVEAVEGSVGPVGQLIIAIPSVLSQPLGIGVARAADAVVLAVELGSTRLAEAARVADAIGRERIVGAFLVRPEPRGRKRR